MRALAFFLLLHGCLGAGAQDLTGTWESDGTMHGYMRMVLVKVGDKYVGYTYDSDGGGYCKVNFEGRFDAAERRLKGAGRGVIRKSFLHGQSTFDLQFTRASGRDFLIGRAQAKGVGLVLSFGMSVPVTLIRKNSTVDTTVFIQEAIAAAQAAPVIALAPGAATALLPVAAAPGIPDSTAALLALRQARRTDTVQVIETPAADDIVLTVYDNGVFDGDSISILHNDRPLATRVAVRTEPFVLRIRRNASGTDETITFIAHNEGRIPPNSALVLIEAGGKQYRLTADTDTKRNALVLLKHRP